MIGMIGTLLTLSNLLYIKQNICHKVYKLGIKYVCFNSLFLLNLRLGTTYSYVGL